MKIIKKIIIAAAVLLIPGGFVFAQVIRSNQIIGNPPGIGVVMSTSTSSGAILSASSSPTVNYITATSTRLHSTFPLASTTDLTASHAIGTPAIYRSNSFTAINVDDLQLLNNNVTIVDWQGGILNSSDGSGAINFNTPNVLKFPAYQMNAILRTINNDGTIDYATNGADYSLISANTCGAGSHFSDVTAAGVFTCSADSGGGGSSSYPFPLTPNGTSTLTYFQGGLYATASSTIGSAVFTTGGLVGIGTSTPTKTLSVQGSELLSGDITSVANITATGTVLVGSKIGVGTTTPFARLSVNPVAGDAAQFVVGSSTATNFIIDGNGNTGIGTTSPITLGGNVLNAKLAVKGELYFAADNTIRYVETRGPTNGFGGGFYEAIGCRESFTDNTNLMLCASTPNNGAGRIKIDPNGGSVYVNAANSNPVLSIDTTNQYIDYGTNGVAQPILRQNFSGGGTLLFDFNFQNGLDNRDSQNLWSVRDSATVSLRKDKTFFKLLASDNTPVFTVQHTGLVGIGSSTPYAMLAIGGGQAYASTSIPLFVVASSSAAVATTTYMMIDPYGFTGIGTSTPTQILSVQGSALISGNITSVANITATGTITTPNLAVTGVGTTTFNGDILARGISAWSYLNVPFVQATSTASSTFVGGVDAARVCIKGTTTCLGGSTGPSINGMITEYAATWQNTADNTAVPMATTTSVTAGQQVKVIASCIETGTARSFLQIGNPGGGTTTGSVGIVVQGASRAGISYLYDYYATTTGKLNISVDGTSDYVTSTGVFSCINPTISYFRLSSTTGAVLGSNGMVNSGNTGQLGYYASTGTSISGSSDAGVFSGLFGLGTTTPYAKMSIQSGASTGDAFVVATSSAATIGGYDNDGHRFTSGPAPFISSCGTGTGTVVGDDQSGTITTATAATACTMTFAKAYRSTPTCTVTDNSLVGFADVASISTSAVTFGISSALTGGNLYYSCSYHK